MQKIIDVTNYLEDYKDKYDEFFRKENGKIKIYLLEKRNLNMKIEILKYR